ncbi:MAG: glutathione S-transferase family protein [Spongiibacteraceae bacterium]
MIHLYHCARSRSMRPLWTLEESGVPYEMTVLTFPPKHNNPSYLDINPMGTIPWLTDGAMFMNESAAMCQYIASRADNSELVLDASNAEYGAWLNWIIFGEASLTYPLSLVIHYSEYYSQIVPGSPVHPDVTEYYQNAFLTAMKLVDKALIGHDYLVADRFSIADISVGYNFVLVEMLGLFDQLPPRIVEYAKRLQARPAFQKTVELGKG